MPYPFDNIFAIDPLDLTKVAANAEVTIFSPGDISSIPLVLTDITGLPLPNPIATNEYGFGPAFIAEIDQVAWVGGGLSGLMESYAGMKEAAVAAQSAAEESAQDAAVSSQAAVDAAHLVGAPADDAVAAIVAGEGSLTRAELGLVFQEKLGLATPEADGVMAKEDKSRVDAIDTSIASAVSAEKLRADSAYKLAPNRMFEGAKLYVYGHSWTMFPSSYATPNTGEYQSRLAARLGLGAVANNGLSGAYMIDMSSAILAATFSGKDRRITPGSKGVVLLQCLINDLVSGSAIPSDAKALDVYKQCLRTFLAAASAGTFLDRDAATYVGSWLDTASGVAQWYPAGKLKQISSIGATASWQVSGDEVWVHASAAAASLSSGAWTARVGSNVVGSFAPQGVLPVGLGSGYMGARTDIPMSVKLTGLNAAAGGVTGTKTLTITTTEAKATYLAGVSIPSATPPRVFVALEAPRNPAAAGMTAWNAWEPVFRQAIIEVCAEFPNVKTVDLAPGWANPTFISSGDGQAAHANDLGMAHIANQFEATIRANIITPDPGVLVL